MNPHSQLYIEANREFSQFNAKDFMVFIACILAFIVGNLLG